MGNQWSSELWRVGGLIGAAVFIGLVLGHVAAALFLAAAGYLGWHLWNLFRLERWLREGKKFQPPDAGGIWGEVYHHFYRLQQRNRKRKRKLGALLNRFQEATAALPDAAVVLGADGAIEWWNEAATRLLGLRYPQDTGQRIDNLVRHPAFKQFLLKNEYDGSVKLPSPLDERIVLTLRIVPYGKQQRLLVARDDTRMHLLEQVRRDFVANVSHELRTPLTVLSGYLETMGEDAEVRAGEWSNSLDAMLQQSRRMQRIVDDLLLLSRLESGRKQRGHDEIAVPAMLAAIREDAVALSGPRAHKIRLEADPELWLRGNGDELSSVFSNLVFNAVQYTPDGGEISMRWFGDAQGAHYEVRDTGVGIEAHHIPRLTERFYRVDVGRSRAQGGTGLGLAIVKHVLQRHGAELRIASELGRGSTFTCDFPAQLAVHHEAQRPLQQAQ